LYDELPGELLSYEELLELLPDVPAVDELAGFLYVCPDVLRLVVPVATLPVDDPVELLTADPDVVLLVVEVLRDTEPDDAGLLDVVAPLPTAARVDAVLLVPNDVLDVVAVLRPTDELLPEGVLFMLAVALPPVVSALEPL
jgi:hypothetical protein